MGETHESEAKRYLSFRQTTANLCGRFAAKFAQYAATVHKQPSPLIVALNKNGCLLTLHFVLFKLAKAGLGGGLGEAKSAGATHDRLFKLDSRWYYLDALWFLMEA